MIKQPEQIFIRWAGVAILAIAALMLALPVMAQEQDATVGGMAPMEEAAPPAAPTDVQEGAQSDDVMSGDIAPAALEAKAAQDAAAAQKGQPATPDQKLKSLNEYDINPSAIPSLLFTYWEYNALQDAKRSRGVVRPPSDNELAAIGETPAAEQAVKPKPPPEQRYLKLGGIVYVHNKDWTIWLNGKMVTPKALPPEAIDLVVKKEYIDIKWFDEYTNQVFPVRLRPHQRFNLDTRIFLPG